MTARPSSVYEHRLLTLASPTVHGRWERLARVQDGLEKGFKQGMRTAVYDFLGGSSIRTVLQEFVEAIENDIEIDISTWDTNFGLDFKKAIGKAIAQTILGGIRGGVEHNMAVAEFDVLGLQRDLLDARFLNFEERYPKVIAEYYNTTSHKGFKRMAAGLIDRGWGGKRTTDAMLNAIGLDERGAKAALNRLKILETKTKSQSKVGSQLSKFTRDSRDRRLDAFAATETMKAINFGQQFLWEEAIKAGDLPKDTRKVWITAADERVCPVCQPMDKMSAKMSGQFKTKAGKVIVPPIHPRCRCTIVPDIFIGSMGIDITRLRLRDAA